MGTKYIMITGGVCSSLGKGLTAAAIGLLLEKQKYKVALLKLDPYLNVDPGTMSPFQHGEVYVTDDGAETDLDLGHYWRFTHSPLSKKSSVTSGQVYEKVIKRERKGDYLGKTVQVIPHITDEIKQRIFDCGKQEEGIDIVLIEIGGTVGDIESLPFLEAFRQFKNELPNDCLNIHLTYVPFLKAAGETKTKPTQHSVQMLREIGIQPEVIVCRSEKHLEKAVKDKISLFCNVPKDHVIEEPDVLHSIYEVPINLKEQGIDVIILKKLGLKPKTIRLKDWEKLIERKIKANKTVTVGVVGKYVSHKDAYKSVYEALQHAAIAQDVVLNLKLIEADRLEKEVFKGIDGLLIPGGFGERGWTGKIQAARWAREKKVPYFGICLGMQVVAVEYARHVLGLEEANSTEIEPNTAHPIIDLMEEQKEIDKIGGTMRLGSYKCALSKGSLAHKAYGSMQIEERHRHRFELNTNYHEALEKAGLSITGVMSDGHLAEIIEVNKHPWMVGVQFHPEFKSRPTEPHPLFWNFIAAIKKYRYGKKRKT